jgi:two-component system chemotaxis sensor kinase CheA
MSHELRTPLNAIILLSKLLLNNKQNNLSQDDIKKAKTIFTSGNELLRLINDILDLSKVEAGKIEIIIDQFNPDELLENLKNLYLDSAKEKGLEFNIINRYNQTISSDMNRISQILKNLISNALKFTKEGSIDVIFEQSDNKQLPIQIIVKDTGIGIPQDKQQDIFEAFTQVDGSISRQYGGTGLGLSIVVQLVSLLGGTIKLESTENKGSQFIINLPNLDQKDLPNNIEDNSNNKPKDESKQEDTQTIEINNIDDVDDTQNTLIVDEVDLDGVNVLVVDDDIKNIFVLDGVLHEYNANSFTAFNGQEALKLLETNQDIDIVLLDLMMPVMDGFETIKNIRNHSSINKDIPIIIVSAKVSQEDKDRSLELGANDFITKPFNMQNLISIIQVYSSKAK